MTAFSSSSQRDVDRQQACPVAQSSQAVPRQATMASDVRPSVQHRTPADRGPISRARRSVARMVALPAHSLPTRSAVRARFGDDALNALAAAFSCPVALAGARRGLTVQLPRPSARQWPSVTDLVRRGNTLDGDVHDAFFRIYRSEDHGEVRHLGLILDGAAILKADLRDAETILDDAVLVRIATGLEHCFALATGVQPASLALPPRRRGLVDDADRSARRWLRGHHVFLVITHGMILALEDLVTACASGTAADQVTAMGVFALLLDISADTMCLTGDFHPDVYDRVIRVAMAPPYMPEGFSGVFSTDHRYLVRRLRENRSMFEALGQGLPGAHREMVASMTRLYDNHKQVCARFVGVDRTSLLMNAGTDDTAIDQLEKFKLSRLRNLGTCPRA